MIRRGRNWRPARWTGVGILALLLALLLAVPGAAQDSTPSRLLSALSDGSELTLPRLDAGVPAPQEVLGYELGSRFSHWHQVLDYLDVLEEASDRVTSWTYGETYEGRPLRLVAISSPGNLARLEEIRRDNQLLAEPADGGEIPDDDPRLDGPAIVWLGYGVHGNESSSSEAAMAVAYILAAAEGEWDDLLEDVVVLLDPLTNPDGRERYVHFFESRQGRRPDAFSAAAEHWEDWPGGRQNHYLVDLNRDWAWATQLETRHRLRAYRRWEPHVHVDLHEMMPESTYFFPPSADPIHDRIDPVTLEWLERFGRANAAAFDARGWIYFAGESFDLFYPGYGDSYPSLRGAVGMTYEMAGHSRAGLELELRDGSTLTLADRIARHATSSLSTARTAAEGHRELRADFAAARRRALVEPVRFYVWARGETEGAWVAELLETHGIQVSTLAEESTLEVQLLDGGGVLSRSFPAGSWITATDQPLGNLLRALMELEWTMPDDFIERQRGRVEQNRSARFYDITTWALPLAANLDVFTLAASPPELTTTPETRQPLTGSGDLGYLAAPAGVAGYRLAAALMAEGVHFRVTLAPFTSTGREYPSGTLFVPAGGNSEGLEGLILSLARESGVELQRVATSFTEKGISLGSESAIPARLPRVGLVGGEGVSVTSFGALWHQLDRQVELPMHRLEVRRLHELELDDFDVVVFPDGPGYHRNLDQETVEALGGWVERGGLLVAIGAAAEWLADRELTTFRILKEEAEPEDAPTSSRGETVADAALDTPGAALNTHVSPQHPLAIGLPRPPRALYRGSRVLLTSGDPQRDLLIATGEPVAAGFAWPEARERLAGSLLAGTERRGDGALVVFTNDPSFRLFWRATSPLFLNAVLYGPSLLERDSF